MLKINFWLLAIVIAFGVTACNQGKEKAAEQSSIFGHPQLKDVTQLIEKDPNNAALYFKRGRVLDKMEQDSMALDDYKKAVSLDSSKSEYFSAIGDVLFEHKDLEGSIKWIERALLLNPQDMQAHLKMAKLFLYTKDYTAAFTHINIALRQDVYQPEGYFLKGMIYKDLKDTAKAINSFQTALQVAPTYREAALQLGLLYNAKNDPLGLGYMDAAFKLDTLDVFPIFAKGVYYQNRKEFETAKKFYKEAILRDNQYADAYFNTGFVLLQQDSTEKAWRQYDLLTKIETDNAEAYYNRGLCSELMGKKQEAITDYRQAMVFDDAYAEPREGLKRLGAK